MKHVVITIGREYGSGGRLIAKQLSEELGITFYDKELITAVARKTGFSENFIRDSEHQRPTNSFLYDLYTAVQTPSVPDQVFIAQAKVIKEAASRESCVIVGRCADYILRDDPNSFRVFVHAAPEQRVQRIQDQFHTSPEQARRDLEATDRGRSWVYKQCTGRSWGDGRYYNLAVDSGKLGIDGSVELILNAIRVWCDVRGVSLTPLAGKNGQD